MRESPALRIRALRKRYAKFEALREVDLDVGAGEAFGLVGANATRTITIPIELPSSEWSVNARFTPE